MGTAVTAVTAAAPNSPAAQPKPCWEHRAGISAAPPLILTNKLSKLCFISAFCWFGAGGGEVMP